jgi:hypothetical protein
LHAKAARRSFSEGGLIMTKRYGWQAAFVVLFIATVSAADLQPKTIAAFDRYVKATEARMASDRAFLWADSLPAGPQREVLENLRKGGLVIERLKTTAAGAPTDIPDGLVHHWLGAVFVPGVHVDDAVRLLQDYDRHADIYKPSVAASRLLSREGDRFRVYLRFYTKKVIAVVVNTENTAEFQRPARDRASSRIVSTRIAEVESPGTPEEREKPVGRDGGYLWRLNTYWRLQERDGGTYVQCESISLTRGIPTGFGWAIGPFVTSIPRETLVFTLETTRKALRAHAGG